MGYDRNHIHAALAATLAGARGGSETVGSSSMLDIRSFQNFIKVIELGSLSRAADHVGLTQPALSQQMAALEKEFSVMLLHRTSKGIVPTEAGLILHSRLQAILRQVEAARDDIASSRLEPVGTAAISLPNSVAEILSVPLLYETQQSFSQIHLQISAMPNRLIFDYLLHNRVDIAIMFGVDFGKGIHSHVIGQEALYLLASPSSPFAESDDIVTPAELHGRRMVLPCRPHQIRSMVDAHLSQNGTNVEIVAEIDSLSNLMQLASTGKYESILPWSAIYREVIAGHIIARPLPDIMQRSLSICVSQHVPLSEASSAVLKLLMAKIDQLVTEGTWKGIRLIDRPQRHNIEMRLTRNRA